MESDKIKSQQKKVSPDEIKSIRDAKKKQQDNQQSIPVKK